MKGLPGFLFDVGSHTDDDGRKYEHLARSRCNLDQTKLQGAIRDGPVLVELNDEQRVPANEVPVVNDEAPVTTCDAIHKNVHSPVGVGVGGSAEACYVEEALWTEDPHLGPPPVAPVVDTDIGPPPAAPVVDTVVIPVEERQTESFEIVQVKKGKMRTRSKAAVKKQAATKSYKPPRSVQITENAPSKNELSSLIAPGDSGITVGFGKLQPDNLTFHGKKVPDGYSVVHVQLLVKPKAALPIPNLNDDPPQYLLGDAAGSLVLWPVKYIVDPK